jgi:hypothetical protein
VKADRPPTREDGYPAETSPTSAEQFLNRPAAHLIEIFGDTDLAFHETESPHLSRNRSIKRDDLYQGLSSLRNDEWLATRSLLDQSRQVCLGFVDVYSIHMD